MLTVSNLVAADDALWDTAVSSFAASRDWVPFVYEVDQRQFNGRGDLVRHRRTVSRLRRGADGDWLTEYVREEDLVGSGRDGPPFGGNDGDDSDERFAAVSANPLDPSLQDAVTVERLGYRRTPDGDSGIAYRFHLQPNPDAAARGTVWIDAETGMPVLIEREVDPPIGVIRDFSAVERYQPRESHFVLVEASYDVVGRILMVERRFAMDMAFRDHRRDRSAARAIRNGELEPAPE